MGAADFGAALGRFGSDRKSSDRQSFPLYPNNWTFLPSTGIPGRASGDPAAQQTELYLDDIVDDEQRGGGDLSALASLELIAPAELNGT